MRMKIGLVVGILAMALVGPVAAQPAAPAAQADTQQQRRDRIKQRVRAIRAYTLTEQLALDEATAAKLFPALAKYDEEFDRLLAARAELHKRLEGAGAIKDAKAVDKVIDDAVSNQRAIWDVEARRLDQLRKILTPSQVARTLIVLPAMERRIQNQLRKVAQKAGKAEVPFDKRTGGELEDVIVEDPKGAKKRAAPAKTHPICDPFASVHGCKNK